MKDSQDIKIGKKESRVILSCLIIYFVGVHFVANLIAPNNPTFSYWQNYLIAHVIIMIYGLVFFLCIIVISIIIYWLYRVVRSAL